MVILVSGSLVIPGTTIAKELKGRVLNTKTRQSATTRPTARPSVVKQKTTTSERIPVSAVEQRRAAVAQQTASAEEQRILGRVRGLEALLAKEEKLLAQRLAYAAKLRQAGLKKNDQKMLDQAEQYERQSLAWYEKRIAQFESVNVATGVSKSSSRKPTPARSQRTSRSRSR